MAVNVKLGRTCKEAAVDYLRYYPSILVGQVREPRTFKVMAVEQACRVGLASVPPTRKQLHKLKLHSYSKQLVSNVLPLIRFFVVRRASGLVIVL
jgi:hypothetical protein